MAEPSRDQGAGPRAARMAARSFRLGMDAQANVALLAVLDELAALGAGGAGLGGELEALLGEVLAAQERADTLRVADLLEHELLRVWPRGPQRARGARVAHLDRGNRVDRADRGPAAGPAPRRPDRAGGD